MVWVSAVACACGERRSHLFSWALLGVVLYSSAYRGGDLARVSSGWLGDSGRMSRFASTLSFTVSVAIQERVADSMYPIGMEI